MWRELAHLLSCDRVHPNYTDPSSTLRFFSDFSNPPHHEVRACENWGKRHVWTCLALMVLLGPQSWAWGRRHWLPCFKLIWPRFWSSYWVNSSSHHCSTIAEREGVSATYKQSGISTTGMVQYVPNNNSTTLSFCQTGSYCCGAATTGRSVQN